MEGILSNIWFVTVIGGALASLAATLIGRYLLNRRPSIMKVYGEALNSLCQEVVISRNDKQILQRALKEPSVKKVINTRTSDPGEEAQSLCKTIGYLASPPSRLADTASVEELVGRWLELEFKIEGTEKYLHHHNRNRERESFFTVPPMPTEVSCTIVSGQVVVKWRTVSHPGIGRYRIARSINDSSSFTEVGIVPAGPGEFLSFTDNVKLSSNIACYYTVTAESRVFKRGNVSLPVAVISSVLPSPTVELSPAPIVSSGFFKTPEDLQEMADRCVDRKRDLAKLLMDISKVNRRLFLIEGFGGLGKTTLTARLALAISSQYNVLWVDCSGIPVTADLFLRELGRVASDQYQYPLLSAVVENPQRSQEEKANGLVDFLVYISRTDSRGNGAGPLQPIAFFFDDYHLVKNAELKQIVLKIAESHVDVKVVLVIRFLPTEFQNEVDTGSAIQLEGLEAEGCRELIAVYASGYPALQNLDDEKLRRIWRLTGQGVPTALRILISMTRKLTLDDVLEELPTLTIATRQKWFDKLFHELSADEQLVAADASIFRRPTSRRTLIAVSRCPRAKEVIELLVDRFVLTFDGKRYSMHALWSDYTSQLLSSAEAKELHLKAAVFYQKFVSEDHHDEVMSHLESCYHFVKAGEMEQAGEELRLIASTLRSWGFFQEFTDTLVEIEQDATARGKLLTPQLRLEKSAMLYAQGDLDQAIAVLNELVKTYSGEIEIKALQELGWIYIETGQRREAEHLLQRSRQLAQQLHLPLLEAEALSRLQHIAYHECNYQQALTYNQERLGILQPLRNNPSVREAIAWTHHEIGNVYREQGFYKEALEFYQRDLPLWNERGNPPSRVGWITYDIGQIYRDLEEPQRAMKQFEEALQIFNKMQHLYGIAHVKVELGRVGARIGPIEPAIAQVEEAIELFRKVKGVTGEAYALGALGQIYLENGKSDLALPYLQQSLEKETELGSIKGRAWSLHRIGLAHEQQGKRLLLSGIHADACSHFCEAAEIIEQAQQLYAQAGATRNIYNIHEDALRVQVACNQCAGSL